MNKYYPTCKCGCKDVIRLRPTFFQCRSCGRYLVANENIILDKEETTNVTDSESRSNKESKGSPGK